MNRKLISSVVGLILVLFITWPGNVVAQCMRGDVNGDCKTTVSDVVYIINYLFKGGPPAVCPDTIQCAAWQDDFESYPPGSWPSRWTPDANAHDNSTNFIDSTVYHQGTKSLRLFGVLGGCWGGTACRPLNTSPPYEIEVAVRNGDEFLYGCHPNRGGIVIRDGCNWVNPARGLLYFSGNIVFTGDSDTLGTFTPLVWYDLKIRYEVLTLTAPDTSRVLISYWIDGQYKGTKTYLYKSDEQNMTTFEVSVDEGTAWFDDVRVIYGK